MGWAAALVWGVGWGVSLWGPGGVCGALIGTAALGQLWRSPTPRPLPLLAGAVVWQTLALAWLGDTWVAFGGDGGRPAALGFAAAQGVFAGAALCVPLAVPAPAWARAALGGALLAVATAASPIPLLPLHALTELPGACWPAAGLGRGGATALWLALWAAPPRARFAGAAVWAIGAAGWTAWAPRRGVPLPIAVVESGVGAFEGRRPSTAPERAERLLAALRRAPRSALTVTAEGAWPVDPGDPGSERRARFTAAFTPFAPIVVGADHRPANALVAVDADGRVSRFDKAILVPVSERRWLGMGRDRYRAGTGPRRLAVGGVTLGPLVCYEDLVPSAVRDAGEADLLLTAANDGWNGEAAWAHLAAARLAAVETGRWTLRPTASGASAIIDPAGRLVAATPFVDRDTQPGDAIVLTAIVRVPAK